MHGSSRCVRAASLVGVLALLGSAAPRLGAQHTDTVAVPAAAPAAAFRAWVRARGYPLRIGEADTTVGRLDDLAPLRTVVGGARLLAVGEPFHGAHEPLLVRNRVVRYCVRALRCTAVALETGLAPSQQLDDYVRGRLAPGDPAASDSALARAFSYDFGRLGENLELLHWLRAYNAGRPDAARVAVYGVDLTGQVFPTAARSLAAVLAYLDRADPALAVAVRARDGGVLPLFRSDTFPELPAAERDRVSGRVLDLVATLRERRVALTAAAGRDAYEWALRQAVGAEQDLAFLRRMPPGFWRRFRAGALGPADRFGELRPLRESAMADNVAWVLAREAARAGPRGRVVLFAHDMHLQGHPFRGDGRMAALMTGVAPAGMYLRAMLGRDLVVLATRIGPLAAARDGRALAGPATPPPDTAPFEAALRVPGRPAYLVDLRALPATGPLRAWLAEEHAVRGGDAGAEREYIRPALAADALVYVDRATRAHIRPP